MSDIAEPEEESPDFDTPVPVDKDGNPDPKAQEKWKPHRGSDPRAPKLVAARVQRIALIMSEGQWSYAAAFALATEWNLKVSTVQQYAVHAGNLLDLLVSSDQLLRSRMMSTLETIISRALNPVDKTGKPTGKPQFREAIEAIRTLAGIAGFDKALEASKDNTRAIAGLADVIGAAARAAVAANASEQGEPSGGGVGDHGGSG
ncbi:hypothetical protein [Sorangium sp. So ce233]|uniref:hypothetical protein n=1 Tax=Sorangium sp. So ce233 TaxID=3133290 RepID=UPI003F641272